jgi:hypothetical protein
MRKHENMKHEHVCIYVMNEEPKLSPMRSQSFLHVNVKEKGAKVVSIMNEREPK